MKYTLDIYAKRPEQLIHIMGKNCRARRLERGWSRRTLSEKTGIPAPTIERFENTGKISLESFCILVVIFDYYDEMSKILSMPKFSTSEQLEIINKNKNRVKGR